MNQLTIFGGHHHNTTNLNGADLKRVEAKASRQEDIILKLFKDHRYTSFTAHEVWMHLGQQWPITSVRRAISNLSCGNNALLRATGEMRDGGYGMKTNCWILNN